MRWPSRLVRSAPGAAADPGLASHRGESSGQAEAGLKLSAAGQMPAWRTEPDHANPQGDHRSRWPRHRWAESSRTHTRRMTHLSSRTSRACTRFRCGRYQRVNRHHACRTPSRLVTPDPRAAR